jgi:hypothetical protein
MKTIKVTENQFKKLANKIVSEQGKVGSDGNVDFSDENYDLVRDYILDNKIDSKSGAGKYRDYYLPLEAKEFFDFIGWRHYEIFRVDNPDHEDYGKKFVEVPSFIV